MLIKCAQVRNPAFLHIRTLKALFYYFDHLIRMLFSIKTHFVSSQFYVFLQFFTSSLNFFPNVKKEVASQSLCCSLSAENTESSLTETLFSSYDEAHS